MKKELLIKEKLRERDNILQMWSYDLKNITEDKRFDQYSRRAKKRIAKLSKKYTPMLVEIESEIEALGGVLEE